MSQLIEVQKENFEDQVLKSELPVLLEFGAPWCVPCKSLEPILEKLQNEWNGKLVIRKAMVDDCTDLAMKYQVISVPTTILFIGGEEKIRFSGLQKPEKLRSGIEPFL